MSSTRSALLKIYGDMEGDPRLAKLRGGCTQLVPGSGLEIEPPVAFIGEAPGVVEDKTGIPFTGRAGGVFSELLSFVGIGRSEVFVTNVVKYRPPGNRTPSHTEIEVSQEYLFKELNLVAPEKIVLLGSTAAKAFGYHTSMYMLHGTRARERYPVGGQGVWFSYHPAVVLYDSSMFAVVLEDFNLIFSQEE